MASILDPAFKPSAALLERTVQGFRYAQALAHELNAMSQYLLRLDNDALAGWLNSQTLQNLQSLLASHKTSGDRVNAILDDVAQQLQDSGQPVTVAKVDTSSFESKLAGQGRRIEILDGAWVVVSIDAP